jgi:Predicted drug exporters of the RND superfamily
VKAALTVVLSFAASMGVSALVFDHVFGFAGADPLVPLYGFVFLVALGIDYNIFLMTRVREESLLHGTRCGILSSWWPSRLWRSNGGHPDVRGHGAHAAAPRAHRPEPIGSATDGSAGG